MSRKYTNTVRMIRWMDYQELLDMYTDAVRSQADSGSCIDPDSMVNYIPQIYDEIITRLAAGEQCEQERDIWNRRGTHGIE